jgi:CRISPR/Cas system-associated exonuclease Cas4 (RecB family)
MIKPRRSADWNYGGKRWRLSRSKIDLFTECPRCFYLDNKLGVARPRPPSFTLNIAVDSLLKKEFDAHRANKSSHPIMEEYGVDAVPFQHEEIDKWRENFEGIEYVHIPTGLTISGAIDDVWVNPKGELMIVDYKATSKEGRLDSLQDTAWENQYKRQMEVYQWLFRQNGFKVSDTGYFVYVNGKKDAEAFDKKLEFEVTLIPHIGKTDWIEDTLLAIKKCLDSDKVPAHGAECEFCNYRKLARDAFEESVKAPPGSGKLFI